MKIEVEPSRVAFDIHEGETVFSAALRNGYSWPTICGGQGTCKTCVFLILEGHENLSAITPWEATALRAILDSLPKSVESLPDKSPSWRLACQTSVIADVRLRKIGVRKLHGNDRSKQAE